MPLLALEVQIVRFVSENARNIHQILLKMLRNLRSHIKIHMGYTEFYVAFVMVVLATANPLKKLKYSKVFRNPRGP